MPTYVYRRPDGTVFEAFQKISDPPLATDPETGDPVVRVISGGAGLQFKGSGFYLTDYARAGSEGKTGEAAESGKTEAGNATSVTSESGTSETSSKSSTPSEASAKPSPAKPA